MTAFTVGDLTTTDNTAAGSTVVYVRAETKGEYHRRRSNEHADRALHLGCRGEIALAELYAELSNMSAEMARIQEFLESL